MATIFISYRRDDAGGHAGRLCDRLTARFGDDHVFMDIQDIQPGQNFVRSIEGTIEGCDVVVAVIGPRWLEMLDERARGDDDFVRHEIATALSRDITLIPVLVGEAQMPQAHRLPADLAELSRRQAVEIRDDRFDDDVARLANAVSGAPAVLTSDARDRRGQSSRRRRWMIPAIVMVVIAAALLVTRPWNLRSRDADGSTEPAGSAVLPANPAIDGVWTADMQDAQQRPFRIRLRFVQSGAMVTGVVEYPTGIGAIHDAALDGPRLTFATTHTPQFASAPATIRFQCEIDGDEIRLTSISESGVATGVATRTPPP